MAKEEMTETAAKEAVIEVAEATEVLEEDQTHLMNQEEEVTNNLQLIFVALTLYVFIAVPSANKVFVSNLSFDSTWKTLKDHFRKAGDVERADVFMDDRGRSRGIGIVEFRSRNDAQRAIKELNDTSLDGRVIFVREVGTSCVVVCGYVVLDWLVGWITIFNFAAHVALLQIFTLLLGR